MSNHMPSYIVWKLVCLVQKLLNLIFSKIPDTAVIELWEHRYWFGLTDGNQGHGFPFASCIAASFLNIFFHLYRMYFPRCGLSAWCSVKHHVGYVFLVQLKVNMSLMSFAIQKYKIILLVYEAIIISYVRIGLITFKLPPSLLLHFRFQVFF